MTRFTVNGATYEDQSDEGQRILAQARQRKDIVRCCCVVESGKHPLLYIARINQRHVLKRQPDTGSEHSPDCAHFESKVNPGRGPLSHAIAEDTKTGSINLKLGFPFHKGLRQASPKTKEDAQNKADPKLDMTAPVATFGIGSLLHFLMEEARFNYWFPRMRGKRNEWTFAKYMRQAVANKFAKREPLENRVFIPFPTQHKDSEQEIDAFVHKLRKVKGQRDKVGIIIDEIDQLSTSGLGMALRLKNLPNHPVILPEPMMKKVEAQLERDGALAFAVQGRALAIVAFTVTANGLLELDRLRIMATTADYLPVFNARGQRLVQSALENERSFLIPMHYDAPESVVPGISMLDTLVKPTNIYVNDTDRDQTGMTPEVFVERLALEDGEVPVIWSPPDALVLPPKHHSRAGNASDIRSEDAFN